VKDFQAFCETTGYGLERWTEEDGVFTFVIRKPA
jgi:TusA-related sulfurtransferase